MRIAFYAPLKAPSHPTPSGDRHMARLLLRALAGAGHEPAVVSEFRSFEGKGDAQTQIAIRRQAAAERDRLIQVLSSAPPPELWFTYHLYHKAPDWLGPEISAHFGIPYVVAEASYAPKQAGGPWDVGHRRAGETIAAADRVFCLNRGDMECVAPLLKPAGKLCYLPPFLDAGPYGDTQRDRQAVALRHGLDENSKWLLSVAMMRQGDKLASYGEMAEILQRLTGDDWQLLVVGGGEAEAEVRRLLAPLVDRVHYAGILHGADLRQVFAACDIYFWPGVGEAFGMAYLEAQASGLPVVAGRRRGVPDVVMDGVGGILATPGEIGDFTAALRRLLDDEGQRSEFSQAAANFVSSERGLSAASALLERKLQ